MQGYEPIGPIDARAAERAMQDADRLAARWEDLRASVDDERLRRAVDRERWRSAVETGIIERLYDVSRGVTEAIVRAGLEADEAGGLDPDVFAQISAHHDAEEVVVDALRREQPLTAGLVKELHAAVTHAQSHYAAREPGGSVVRRPLPHGEYKDHDNYVQLPDGSERLYAPPLRVPDEMEQLVELARVDDHPVRVAALVHHRLSQIHPFADGNGRTARLVASLLLVRGGYLPLVVERERRDEYLAALRAADTTSLLDLLDFFVARQGDSLRRIEAAVFEDAPAGDLAALSDALADYAARRQRARRVHRDLEQQVVLPLVRPLQQVVNQRLNEALEPFKRRGFDALPIHFPSGELRLDAEGFKQQVADSGFAPAPRPRVGWLESGFRIGDMQERHILLGCVALSPLGDEEAALLLADIFHGPFTRVEAPLLTVAVETVNEREIERWVDAWLGQMLVDYTRRL